MAINSSDSLDSVSAHLQQLLRDKDELLRFEQDLLRSTQELKQSRQELQESQQELKRCHEQLVTDSRVLQNSHQEALRAHQSLQQSEEELQRWKNKLGSGASLADASFDLAVCRTRGIAAAATGQDPSTELTFEHSGDELVLKLRHCAHESVHTGGHIWSASRHVGRWLFARRSLLPGLRVLELGCGLALPSILASRCGAEAVASDHLAKLSPHTLANAAANDCSLSATKIDFTLRADVEEASAGAWDLIMFADCIYGGKMGEALPLALARLLRGRPAARAVGAFPPEQRAGIATFWQRLELAGVEWTAIPSPEDDDPRSSRLYVFRCPLSAAALRMDLWDELKDDEDDVEAAACGIEPLFESAALEA